MAGKIYRARTGGLVNLDGRRTLVQRGATVREGHPLLAGGLDGYEEFVPDYEYEQPEPKAPAASKARAAGTAADK